MKNILKNIIAIPVGIVLMSMFISSCSDWTDTKSLNIDQPKFEKDNPSKYAKYLQDLRDYRNSDHKVVLVSFDNREVPMSRAYHLNTLPDSIDIISLSNPDNLPAWIQNEMAEVRKDKGMKIIYTISYSTIERLYKEFVDGLEEGSQQAETDGFIEFASKYMDKMLPLADKFKYDGLSVYYKGKATNHMQDDEKEAFLARQAIFMSKTKAWVDAHPDKLFIFQGTPQFLEDKSILVSSKYIVLDATDIQAASTLTFEALTMVSYPDVPKDRCIVAVDTYPLDASDVTTGRFYDIDGRLSCAVKEAAYWISTPDSKLVKAGIFINNIQNDYHSIVKEGQNKGKNKAFKYTREAIEIMNPSPKH